MQTTVATYNTHFDGEVFLEERNNTWNTPFLFNGKELDEETGLYYYGARYYNPRISLWYGADPLAEKYPSESPYCNAGNNPIAFIDPNGLTKYYNLKGVKVRNVEDGSDAKAIVQIYGERYEAVTRAISKRKVVPVVSDGAVQAMETAYNKTEQTGNEHGFRVGHDGTVSTIVEGRARVIEGDDWIPAANDVGMSETAYDVHTHPLETNENGEVVPGLAKPSGTDKDNYLGTQPSVVLGYKEEFEPDTSTGASSSMGGGDTSKCSYPRRIGFYDSNGQVGSSMYFSEYKDLVNTINTSTDE